MIGNRISFEIYRDGKKQTISYLAEE
jgi:hypothetical protein